MHTTSAFLVALTCLAAATPSQGGISPPNLAESWGNGCNTLPYGQTLHRWQQLYEASALPPTLTPGRVITQVGWRRCGSNATYNPATLDIDAGIYNVPLTQATLSGTFATNRSAGTGGTVFVRKLVNLPAMPFGSPTDTFVMLPLDSPHTFAGPGLLLEVVAYGATV